MLMKFIRQLANDYLYYGDLYVQFAVCFVNSTVTTRSTWRCEVAVNASRTSCYAIPRTLDCSTPRTGPAKRRIRSTQRTIEAFCLRCSLLVSVGFCCHSSRLLRLFHSMFTGVGCYFGGPAWGRGTPFLPCPFTSPSFAFFYFSLFSLALTISSFVHPFPFYQNSTTPFPGRRS